MNMGKDYSESQRKFVCLLCNLFLLIALLCGMLCRRPRLEAACESMLAAQYGLDGARLIKEWGLMEHPVRLTVNKKWEERNNGERTCWSRQPPS